MMTSTTPTAPRPDPPPQLRQLDTASASVLVELSATFEDLQTVLRCCERLVAELESAAGEPDDVVIESAWTVALLSYARCFLAGKLGASLTEDDLTATKLEVDVLAWHKVLLTLRNHYASPTTNPRELFSVGVAQDSDGVANGIAITSARQPLVEALTVRQTGQIALALSDLVNDRITAQQKKVFGDVQEISKADLAKLHRLDVGGRD